MSRPIGTSNRVPSYCLHKPTSRAYVNLGGKFVYLGDYGTPESREKYDRVVGEYMSNGRRLAVPIAPVAPTTVAQVIAAFWRHAQDYHRNADGTPAGELDNYRLALRPLNKLYGNSPVAEFGPRQMKAVRHEMVQSGWARTYINRQLGRLRHVFNWCVEEELIPVVIATAVGKVKGLRQGKTEAKESAPVEPVPDDVLRATLPFLSVTVRSMVELQILTGMRGGEVCAMRMRDLDMPADGLWHYRPAQHKTAHRGIKRSVPIGPKAREIITPFLSLDPDAYLFNPAKAEADRHAALREQRKTRVQPSQQKRSDLARRRKRSRAPQDHYDIHSYRRAIARACDKADSWSKGGMIVASEERVIPSWHPHQLRHGAAALIASLFGLEATKAVLGHKTLRMTEHYAGVDEKAADRVAAAIG